MQNHSFSNQENHVKIVNESLRMLENYPKRMYKMYVHGKYFSTHKAYVELIGAVWKREWKVYGMKMFLIVGANTVA